MGAKSTTAFWITALVLLGQPLLGQNPSAVTFSYRNSSVTTPTPLATNGTLDLGSAMVGTSSAASLIVANADVYPWTIVGFATSGPPFVVTSIPNTVIGPGQSQAYGLAFSAAVKGAVSGTLTLRLVSGFQILNANFFLTGTAVQANLISSYVLAANGNQILLADTDSINFPVTQVGQTSNATFVISNTGTGPGTVTAVSVGTGAFKLSGLPLLPMSINAGMSTQFSIAFSPTTPQAATALLQVTFPDRMQMITLNGQGAGASFAYDAMIGSADTTILANGTVSLPSTNIGSSSSAIIRIRNTGNGDGQVSTIAVTGSSFQLTNLPVLPVTIPAGQAVTFIITFSPSQSGAAQGQLRMDSVTIAVTGTGLGSVVSLAVTQGGTTSPVANSGAITFPNTAVGSQASATVQITNTGNVSTQVNSISLTGAGFSLANIPALPAPLDPGASVSVTVNFVPGSLGAATGALQIDAQRINLTGVGLPPPALPAVSFGALPDSVNPAQQPAVSLNLAAAYPLDVSGTLTLSFTSQAFVDDQAIQFSTGGRTVSFTIPANATQAIFGSGATQLQFQSGTVAGTITLTASFATGTVSLTPTPAPAKTVTIAASAPVLRNAQIGSRTANSFVVVVSGLSTPRAVSELDLQFTPTPGSNLQTTTLTLNVDSAFSAWYQGASSAPFGSQFSISVSIIAAGDVNAVQAVSVTAKNQSGASSPVSVSLH